MSDLDEIKKRLDKLREFNSSEKKQDLTDENLQTRLNRLRGLEETSGPKEEKSDVFLNYQKFRTDVQQSDDLFNQLCDEVDVENQFKQANNQEDERLLNKLSNLRMNGNSPVFDPTSGSSTYHNEDGSLFGFNNNFVSKTYDRLNQENENIISKADFTKEMGLIKNQMKELNYHPKDVSKATTSSKSTLQMNPSNNQAVKRIAGNNSSSEDEENYEEIAKRFVDETKLEGQVDSRKVHENVDKFKETLDEDFDFCYICNEDAVIECKDCIDRYCLSCFKEFHEDPEYRMHRYSRFYAKK